MAITNARMQIKRGNEVDFDAEKMLVGEWALSTDKRIVRICVAPNVCIRMATYDAFEVDMAQIDKILEECRTIEDVVKLINSQVSGKLELTIEYTKQAKQYRDEAEQFRNEAEQFAPDGYVELKETVASNTAKIDTIIEKAELNIKNSASGENLHLTDSANGKNVGFGLYGKAEQKQYSGKNLFKNTLKSTTHNGVTYTVNDDGSVTASGTATATSLIVDWNNEQHLQSGKYILSGCPSGGSSSTYRVLFGLKYSDGTYLNDILDYGNGKEFTITQEMADSGVYGILALYVLNGQNANNLVFYPMIRLASITDDTYEPYVGGIASPNPDYPQEITVSGSDGSVEVMSCGKNLLKNLASSHVYNGITFTVNDDGSVTANGTSTGDIWVNLTGANSVKLDLDGNYILSGCPIGGSVSKYALTAVDMGTDDAKDVSVYRDEGKGVNVLFDSTHYYKIFIRVYSGATLNNLTFYPMIRLASDTDSTYEPYTETLSTIPTPNGLAGIKVSSGGNYTDENGQQWITDEIVKYADGSGKRIQRYKKLVVDGVNVTFSGKSSSVNNNIYRLTLSDVKNTKDNNTLANVICTHFSIITSNIGFNNDIEGVYVSNGYSYMYFCFGINSELSTLEQANAWLVDNPFVLYYELAEPIITDLSAEEIAEIEKLYTFYPITNISNDADCGMSITYTCDSKRYIDNRIEELASALLVATM